jgi:peptidoglycan hydrolase CwlO-like protein
MDDKKLLRDIGDLIDTKLNKNLKPINEKLGILDSKVETLDLKIEAVNSKVDKLDKKIDKSQEETIEVLSELITTGYNSHEKRIKRVEDHLHLPQIQ